MLKKWTTLQIGSGIFILGIVFYISMDLLFNPFEKKGGNKNIYLKLLAIPITLLVVEFVGIKLYKIVKKYFDTL
jgi:hypothetical protein